MIIAGEEIVPDHIVVKGISIIDGKSASGVNDSSNFEVIGINENMASFHHTFLY